MNGKLNAFQEAKLNLSLEILKKNFPDLSEEILQEQYERLLKDKIFINDEYQVNVSKNNRYIHLSIKRIDKEPIHDWRDLQQIKNMIVGEETEAIEVYPAESRLVDSANQYHLWVCLGEDGESLKIPVGYNERLVEEKEGSWKQRKF